jgi:signal transduction histidine kinase
VAADNRREQGWWRRFRSFRTKLLVLVAIAVSVPAVLTCVILGRQLDRQARASFASGLSSNLETFALILQDTQTRLDEGLARAATDNTLQVTLDLDIRAQLNKYIDGQRQALRTAFLSVYDRNFRPIAFSGVDKDAIPGQWHVEEKREPGRTCLATREPEQQLISCNSTVYLVSIAPVLRAQDANLGDGSGQGRGTGLLGYLLSGTPLAGPRVIASLQNRQITHPLIWVDDRLIYNNIHADGAPPLRADGSAREYNFDNTAYLGAVKKATVGTQTFAYEVMEPLAPMRSALLHSVLTVAGIGLLLVAMTLIAGGFIATRLLRPIQQLRVGAARLGGGDLSQRISVKTGDEIEALADQFNEMAGKLQESYAGLEQKVTQRTAELSKSLEELRTAQDRLVQTEKLASLGQLTAGIAHEIKNPLNFVNNFSSVSIELIGELEDALKGVQLDDKTQSEVSEVAGVLRGNLDKIVQHGKRADSIVKNMLLHSRAGAGDHRPVNINAVVEESLNLAYHGARAEKQGFNITLERSFDPDAGDVDLFPQEITRVLLNLISNGFYAATKRKAEVAGNAGFEPVLLAATKSLGDRVEIRIRDNGTGIPQEVKDKMFNPFFTTKPAGEGTGLGLSISHDIIVKQHAGSIVVDTRTGEFTEFKITLPRKAAALGQSGAPA